MSEFIVIHWVDRDAAYRDGRYWPMLTEDDCSIDPRVVELAATQSDGSWREVWVTDVLGDHATAPADYAAFLSEYSVSPDGLATRLDGNDPDAMSITVPARQPAQPREQDRVPVFVSETPEGLVLDLSMLDPAAIATALGLSGSPAAVVGTGDGGVTGVSVFLDPSKAVARWYEDLAGSVSDPRLSYLVATEARDFLGGRASGIDSEDIAAYAASAGACTHQSDGLASFVVGQAEMVLS